MAHQSTLAAEGADEHDQYWELIWANLVSTMQAIKERPFESTLRAFYHFSVGLRTDHDNRRLYGHQSY